MTGNRSLLEQYLDAYNSGEWDRLDEFVTADYVHNNGEARLDLAAFKRGAAWIRSGVPDFRVDVEDMIGEGDRVAVRFVGRGAHSGSFAGETPTGNDIVVHGITMYRLRDGLIAEDWEAMDEGQLMQQIAPTGA